MPNIPIGQRLKHAWNAFNNKDPTHTYRHIGASSFSKPDRVRLRGGNEQSIVVAVLNRIAIDVSAIRINHVKVDEEGSFENVVFSGLNYCLSTEANIDQTARAFMIDVVMSLFDEGCIAVIPVETTIDPRESNSYDIQKLRTGKILEWFPEHVRVSIYNERTALREEITLPKKTVAIIENPLYAVMNARNSTLQRLIRKLNILDAIDEQSGSGKLDIIIQLPYSLRSDAQKERAEIRRQNIEDQLANSQHGIAYIDATERITQLNRPVENNLMAQIQYLTSMLYSQLAITEGVFNGTASEAEMLNYMSRIVEPVLMATLDEFERKFLTKTARTQKHKIMYFKDVFRLVPANELANVADRYTRNEILSPNEIRALLGKQPSRDPRADELRNRNLNASTQDESHLKEDLLEQEVELAKVDVKRAKKDLKTGTDPKTQIKGSSDAVNNQLKGDNQNGRKTKL